MTTTIPLRQLGAEHLNRWIRVDGLTGILHSVGHSRTGITSVDVRPASGGLRLGFGRPEVEHYTSDTKGELLHACEACENPIVDEEPTWGGPDNDEPLHPSCAEDLVREERAAGIAEMSAASHQHDEEL